MICVVSANHERLLSCPYREGDMAQKPEIRDEGMGQTDDLMFDDVLLVVSMRAY